jgi:hypothetical protein
MLPIQEIRFKPKKLSFQKKPISDFASLKKIVHFKIDKIGTVRCAIEF